MRLFNRLLFFWIIYTSCMHTIQSFATQEQLNESTILMEPQSQLVQINNDYFNIIVSECVEKAISEKNLDSLPHGLIDCYEKISNNTPLFTAKELEESVTYLLETINKAPRPSLETPEIAGQLECDTAKVYKILQSIKLALIKCCNSSATNFNITFSALYDIDSTFTACCENTLTQFENTFTVLNFGFNSTYTIFESGFNTTFTLITRLTTEINNTSTTLNINCDNTFNIVENCCNSLIPQLAALIPIMEALGTGPITTLVGNECFTYCLVNDVFPIFGCEPLPPLC